MISKSCKLILVTALMAGGLANAQNFQPETFYGLDCELIEQRVRGSIGIEFGDVASLTIDGLSRAMQVTSVNGESPSNICLPDLNWESQTTLNGTVLEKMTELGPITDELAPFEFTVQPVEAVGNFGRTYPLSATLNIERSDGSIETHNWGCKAFKQSTTNRTWVCGSR